MRQNREERKAHGATMRLDHNRSCSRSAAAGAEEMRVKYHLRGITEKMLRVGDRARKLNTRKKKKNEVPEDESTAPGT